MIQFDLNDGSTLAFVVHSFYISYFWHCFGQFWINSCWTFRKTEERLLLVGSAESVKPFHHGRVARVKRQTKERASNLQILASEPQLRWIRKLRRLLRASTLRPPTCRTRPRPTRPPCPSPTMDPLLELQLLTRVSFFRLDLCFLTKTKRPFWFR